MKTIKVAEGVTIADDVKFDLVQITDPSAGNGHVTAPNETVGTAGSTFTEISGIKNGGDKATYSEGTYTLTAATKGKTQANDNADKTKVDNEYVAEVGLNFSEAKVGDKLLDNGLYTFKVTEEQTGYTKIAGDGKGVNKDYGWTLSKAEYILRVYVSTTKDANGEDKRTVKYTIEKDKDDAGSEVTTNKKQESAAFENTYTARGNSTTPGTDGNPDRPQENTDPALTITKTVENAEYLVAGTKFGFTVKFTTTDGSPAVIPTVGEGETADSVFGAKILETDKKEVTGKVLTAKENETNEYKFSLENGQTIQITNIPAGVHYEVTEDSFSNDGGTTWTTKYDGVQKATGGNKNLTSTLIGEKKNEASFVNTIKNITVTGVVTHTAPFVVMIGALFAAVGGYVVLKKKVEE